ncbi:L-2-hydroxyglutarate dehydrogenase, mitochondrial [Strongyloides ratti]|uniref:L-2-hydroxyglutarate dehydrogenase, mitochondrial n=1 Tax=Strongyloides ratti TaxID=34506 RepID=A0A090LMP3_STRRB|nr:L-2-hydroxyglutarate dehydrogenase, mitochondrial [Strongyloides ratti]CEF69443.1 L-2-hydroxyglutarate dehydrogenase, mitochondrial [Strongyloides ratti]
MLSRNITLQSRLLSSSILNTNTNIDIAVIGGGIIGSATARKLKLDKPHLKIALYEKESTLAKHQTGHNSGVLHAGIYYKPGTLKAKLCVEGIDLAYKYCDEKNIPYKKVGKLIVAVEPHEISILDDLYKRAQKNNCKNIELIDGNKIREIENNCRGLKAIWSPYTGIVDFGVVSRQYAKDFEEAGGVINLNHELCDVYLGSNPEYPVNLKFKNTSTVVEAKYIITAGGLYSDRVAQMTGCSSIPKILPFRGEYLKLKKEKSDMVKTNIYPVPDPRFPFLGVHFTPRMNGDIWLGPNAVLAYKREGYRYTDISVKDLIDSLAFKGMQKLIFKYFTFGISEMYKGIVKNAQVKQLQRFVPSLKVSDVEYGSAGVRAQALDEDGNLVDDFIFDGGVGKVAERVLHVRNAPSPAATSSLAIANIVTEKAIEKFKL